MPRTRRRPASRPRTPAIEIDRQSGEIRAFEQEVDEETEEVLKEEFVETPPELGRIAAQTAKHVIHQKLREAERQMAFEEYEDRAGEIVTGIVEQHDPRFVILNLGKAEAIMPYSEQIPRERYEIGDRVRAYIVEVREGRGPTIVVSRSHPGLVRKLFEMEVPEIQDGLVDIKAIAREAGHRTKIAVASNDTNIDPVGACVGPKGTRVRAVVNELRGEKIDVVSFTDDISRFVSEALQPARVRGVQVDPDSKTATVIVADRELSLAIGKEGQNARLAARLTGWRIDIKSESQRAAGAAPDVVAPFEPTAPERRGRTTDGEADRAGSGGLRPRRRLKRLAEAPAEAAAEAPAEAAALRRRPSAGEAACRRPTGAEAAGPSCARAVRGAVFVLVAQPTRTCIGCRRKAPKDELVRIVRAAGGRGRVDPAGRAPGRGAYVCNVGCLSQAVRRRRVGRHLRAAVEAAQLEVDEELGRRAMRERSAQRRMDRRLAKVRVHEAAKKLGISSKELLEKLKAAGVEVKTASSSVDEAVIAQLNGGAPPRRRRRPRPSAGAEAGARPSAEKPAPRPRPAKPAPAAGRRPRRPRRRRPHRTGPRARGRNRSPSPSPQPAAGARAEPVPPPRRCTSSAGSP